MNLPKVENVIGHNGNAVRNQFYIYTEEGRVFQSYSTIIGIRKHDGTVVLDKNSWDVSSTTGKYRNQFLGEGIAETRKKIEAGVYQLANLNG